ncbi:MAG: hypothetical protein MdMp014T_0604 [Treponematales bacterium]
MYSGSILLYDDTGAGKIILDGINPDKADERYPSGYECNSYRGTWNGREQLVMYILLPGKGAVAARGRGWLG